MGVCSNRNARRQAICEIVLVATTPYGFTDIRMRSVNLPGERETLTVGELEAERVVHPGGHRLTGTQAVPDREPLAGLVKRFTTVTALSRDPFGWLVSWVWRGSGPATMWLQSSGR